MLGKLIKHEIRATGRIFLPLYGALFILALLNKIIFEFNDSVPSSAWVADLISGLSLMVYICVFCAVLVLTVVITVQRFYKNLLGDEGYLMLTLPVKPWQHIVSKLIVATVWSIVSGIVATLTVFVIGLDMTMIRELPEAFALLIQEMHRIGLSPIGLSTASIVLMLVSILMADLMMYFSIAVGQLSGKHKLATAFGAFIVVNFITNFITGLVGDGLSTALDNFYPQTTPWLFTPPGIPSMMLVMSLWCAIYGALFFFGTEYLLRNKLNLE